MDGYACTSEEPSQRTVDIGYKSGFVRNLWGGGTVEEEKAECDNLMTNIHG